MAIDGNVYSGKEVQIGIAGEGAFGTPTGSAGAYTQLVEFGSVAIDYGLTQELGIKNRGRRTAHTDDTYVTEQGGMRTITVSDYIVRKGDFADFLYAVFQNVTEDGASPYTKTFQFPDTQPNFAADGGHFLTVAIKMPLANRHLMFTSCIVSELKLKADLVGGDSRLKADITLVSGFSVTKTANFTGVWTVKNQQYIPMNDLETKQIAGNDVVLYGFDLTIKNNAVRVGNGSSGVTETYAIGIDEYEYILGLKVKYDSNVSGLIDNFSGGSEVDAEIVQETNQSIEVYANNWIFTTHDHDFSQQQGIAIDLEGKCLYDGTDMPYIKFTDNQDKGW